MSNEKVLRDELARWRRTPFRWGHDDCMLAIATYVAALRGIDGGARWRGRYSTRLGCLRVTGFHLDPVGVADQCAAAAGLRRTTCPDDGDIGVIRAVTDGQPVTVGGILIGGLWAVRGARGVQLVRSPEVLAAWAV